MPWCPKCKIEYVEGIKTCSDCHVDLIDEYPADDYSGKYDPGKLELLVAVADEDEAGRVEALLISNDVPAVRKHGDGDGDAGFGTKIYVPEKFMKKALTILQHEDEAETAVILEEEIESFEDIDAEEEEEEASEACEDGGDNDESGKSVDYSPEIRGENNKALKYVLIGLAVVAVAALIIFFNIAR